MTSTNLKEQLAELLLGVISDIDSSSPAYQFAGTEKGRTYLRNLGEALPYRFSQLKKWLPEVCPQCGWSTGKGDTAGGDRHVVMSILVVVTCAGLPTVDPNEVGVHSPGWVDWTQASIGAEWAPEHSKENP